MRTDIRYCFLHIAVTYAAVRRLMVDGLDERVANAIYLVDGMWEFWADRRRKKRAWSSVIINGGDLQRTADVARAAKRVSV